MAEQTLIRNTPLPDIDSHVQPTREEAARMRATSSIHTYALLQLRFACRKPYEEVAVPKFVERHGREPRTGREAAEAMEGNQFYRTYSAIRYNAQEMVNMARQPAVERALPDLVETAKLAVETNPAGGSLRIDPDFEVPSYMTDLDVHLAPGSYHTEYVEGDVAQGVMLGAGSAGRPKGYNPRGRNFATVGASIAHYLKEVQPDFNPRRVLDMGTQSGANLMAYPTAYPGCEAYGVDVAAPGLRYGHAKAAHAGIPVHFSQQNAAKTDFADGYFDLVVSSFFLHEVPLETTHEIMEEAWRLLSPGGMLVFMELPPHKSCEPFMNLVYDWDTRHNNEPFYETYRMQDPTELMVQGGFPRETTFERTIPDVGSFDLTRYPAFLAGEVEAPPHGRGGWFIFGARKQA